jgi:hypothetical protein
MVSVKEMLHFFSSPLLSTIPESVPQDPNAMRERANRGASARAALGRRQRPF